MSRQPEHDLQKQIVSYLRGQGILTIDTDVMSGLMFLGNNQRMRYGFINHHKRMGYTAGQADLILLLNDGETLLVELKDGKNNNQSEEQRYFEGMARNRGHNYVVWRKFEDAVDFIKGYRNI